MGKEIIETSTASFWLNDEGIIQAVIKKDAKLILKDAVENVEIMERIGSPPRLLFVDIRLVKSVTKELRDYFASKEVSQILPVRAILVGSPVAKIMGDMFLRVMDPAFEAKIFIEESAAMEWLRSYSTNSPYLKK